MESSALTAVLLPLALFIIMLGMGLGLTVDDLKRVVVEPRAMVLGLLAQLVMLPLVGFGLAIAFPLSPELAVGVMVLAACPGGPTSNLISYLVRGNVALSISLTAISSLVTVFTIPLVVNGAMQFFLGTGSDLQLPFGNTVLQIAVITLVPVSLGMVLHRLVPVGTARLEAVVKWLSLAFLGLIIAGLLVQERQNVLDFLVQVGLVTLTLNVVTMALGYAIGLAGQLPIPSRKAIAVEVGIQNGTLAIAVASAPTLLNQPTLAIPAAIYSLLMFVTSAVFAVLVRRIPDRV